jgi:hypothetical protein
MATGRVPTTANSPLTAKGDLFGYSTAPARLAVGNDGEQIVADSSTSTGLRYQGNFAAGKNKIINGDFGINQRSFTSNTANGSYNFDRFYQISGGSGLITVTPQTFTPGAAPVTGYEATNFVRCVTSSGSTANTYALYEQKIEDVRTFANQTITVSFWAKTTSGTPKLSFEIEQACGSGGSGSFFTASSSTATLSTSWTRYSFTIAVPSLSGKTIGTSSALVCGFWLSAGSDFNARANSIGIQNATFDIWGLQVEAGSVATAFQTATGTIQGEIAACQRYYFRFTGTTNRPIFPVGGSLTTTIAQVQVQHPVKMRTEPTVLDNATWELLNYANNTAYTSGTLTLSAVTEDCSMVRYTHGSAIFTAGEVVGFRSQGGGGYIGIGAEL